MFTISTIVNCFVIEKLRTLYWCEVCGHPISTPHVYVYGGYPKKVRSHVCLDCAQMEGIDERIRKAAERYLNRSPSQKKPEEEGGKPFADG